MVSRIVCFFLMAGLLNAATFIGKLQKKPLEHAHKTGCYIPEINDVIPYGEMVAPVGICHRIECGKDMLTYATCGVVMTNSPNCYVADEDLSLPYPRCCPQVKCQEDNYLN